MIQSQHVAERAKLGTHLLNRSKMSNEEANGVEFDSREARSRNGRRGAKGAGKASKERTPLKGPTMPKIVTAAGAPTKAGNPLEIDRDGNRTHLKLAAVDALNPAAAFAKRNAKGQKDDTEVESAQKDQSALSHLAPADKVAPTKGGLLAHLIGERLKKDVAKEKERILREAKELCAQNFDDTNGQPGIGDSLQMHKALDRIKYLKKQRNTLGGADAADDNDDFASIEARINPKDGKSESKGPGRRAEGEDTLPAADKRAGTAAHLFQNAHLRRRRVLGSLANNKDLSHVRASGNRKRVDSRGVTDMAERQSVTDKPARR